MSNWFTSMFNPMSGDKAANMVHRPPSDAYIPRADNYSRIPGLEKTADLRGRQWLYNRTRESRAAQDSALNKLRDVATGKVSYAQQQAAKQRDATRGQQQSLAQTAQRGGFDASAGRTAQLQGDTAARNITQQAGVASQLERQSAARAFMSGSDAALKGQLGMEKYGQRFNQMALDDRSKQNQARQQLQNLYLQNQYLYQRKALADQNRDGVWGSSVLGAGAGLLGGIVEAVSDKERKKGVSSGEQEARSFMDAIGAAYQAGRGDNQAGELARAHGAGTITNHDLARYQAAARQAREPGAPTMVYLAPRPAVGATVPAQPAYISESPVQDATRAAYKLAYPGAAQQEIIRTVATGQAPQELKSLYLRAAEAVKRRGGGPETDNDLKQFRNRRASNLDRGGR